MATKDFDVPEYDYDLDDVDDSKQGAGNNK